MPNLTISPKPICEGPFVRDMDLDTYRPFLFKSGPKEYIGFRHDIRTDGGYWIIAISPVTGRIMSVAKDSNLGYTGRFIRYLEDGESFTYTA